MYQPTDTPIDEQFASGGDDDEEAAVVATVCELPSRVWEGLWDTLIYDDDIKPRLLDYIYATLVFSDASVDCEWTLPNRNLNFIMDISFQQISYHGIGLFCCTDRECNRRHALDGILTRYLRPGTGKTSLARALAQKLAIRLQHRYSAGARLLELNAHSLFSRWFSESGKLVQRAFSGVMEMADDPDVFVVLLIGGSVIFACQTLQLMFVRRG